ncbi:MAG: DUF7064 domain-containing protein [Acidimicrobiales bacterium]
MPVRLELHDDYTHAPGNEINFNESMYFNFYDSTRQLGGFFRVGNRVNEGRAEVTACVFLPDGSVAFTYRRPHITTNDTFDSAGLRFEIIRPFEEMRVRYDGTLTLLEDPLAMADPKRAFTENPAVPCSADLGYTGEAPAFGGEPEVSHERPGEEFAKAHYEQLMGVAGIISVGDHRWEVTGHGLRDHSWGPRSWQAPWYYRWLVGHGDDFGFMASRVARRDGEGSRGGFVWDGQQLHLCDRCEISTTWTDTGRYHRAMEVRLGSVDAEWVIRGQVLNLIPLRNRRDGLITRISEGLTEWTLGDGRIAHGLSEYLDQIIDGEPVGVGE